jgi:hypothetical protein
VDDINASSFGANMAVEGQMDAWNRAPIFEGVQYVLLGYDELQASEVSSSFLTCNQSTCFNAFPVPHSINHEKYKQHIFHLSISMIFLLRFFVGLSKLLWDLSAHISSASSGIVLNEFSRLI